jgi:CheY-like chemotaxis protein
VVVWVVDDVEANHDLVRRSLPHGHEDACDLTGYLTAREALDALALLLADRSEHLPDVIFMDFFLGDGQGDDVTRAVREAFAAAKLAGPFIVGHSSASGGSREIVKAGGDVAITKDKASGVSPGVQELFPDAKALRKHAGRARRKAAK